MAKHIQKTSLLSLFFLNLILLVASKGTQFITGVCKADADCASACCGFKSGKCAGPIIAQERDGGCGFGDAQPNDIAAQVFRGQTPTTRATVVVDSTSVAAPITAPTTNPAAGSGKALGTQFITGACARDAECASACCGFKSGKCAGPIIAQERDGGCGFGDAKPNDIAAQVFRGQTPTTLATVVVDSTSVAAPTAAPATGSGKALGTQFITGACASDKECASACCGFRSGKCAGPIIAQERDGGCGFGDAQPNDTAAKALRGGK